jgi:hypothetical protein
LSTIRLLLQSSTPGRKSKVCAQLEGPTPLETSGQGRFETA